MKKVTNYRILKNGTQTNNQYEILDLICEDGFRVIYLIIEIYLQLKIAIKDYFSAQFSSRNIMNGNNSINVILGV